MKLNNIWGYGQLFGFSALDGQNRYYNDFIGTLTKRKIEIRFELQEWVKVYFPVKGRAQFRAVTGDMIDAKLPSGEFFLTFFDADTVVGYSPIKPEIIFQKKMNTRRISGVDVYWNSSDAIAVLVKQEENGLYRFSISHSTPSYAFACCRVGETVDADLQALKEARYDYYKKLPKCKDKRYERLYYKALSVQKVNVRSAEGRIPCVWTTPDRVPHKQMWLWDSVFHALAIVTYNPKLAKDCIRSVLSQQREDGFIASMASPYSRNYETQPQVLAWGVWEVYRKTKDKAFLAECAPALDKYLTWDRVHRDKNGNGLLEWLVESDYTECKSGESGQDNSPRFEFDEGMDAIDFSAFQAHDSEYLSKIYAELGDEEKSQAWKEYSDYVKAQINALLWDEEDGVYYDRLESGAFTKILTPSMFFPLMAGVPTAAQAVRMVKALTDPELLWTKLPLATVSKNHPMYGTDMWRGGVWLNLNYFIIKGLHRYGYVDLAEELKTKTLEAVNKWYKKTGVIYEFYDSKDAIYPYECERKGKPIMPPDWRKHVHSISDFNWSSCFTLMFIQNELYLD